MVNSKLLAKFTAEKQNICQHPLQQYIQIDYERVKTN